MVLWRLPLIILFMRQALQESHLVALRAALGPWLGK